VGGMEEYMRIAIAEARTSLRVGNHGFGAVVLAHGQILAAAHDTEETDADPTAHAEIAAIRQASGRIGKDLSSCTLVCTHEPCPMCAAAIVWAKIPHVVFGYGIADALAEGRTRIAVTCDEVFAKVSARVAVERGVLKKQCSVLYRHDVREEVKRLRGATDDQLRAFDAERAKRRVDWFRAQDTMRKEDPLEAAYTVLLRRLGITEDEAPVVHRDGHSLTFHSKNFCPTLAACEILGLDTRTVCELYNSRSPDALIREVDPRLEFSRDYEKIRPRSEFCEESIRLRPASGKPSSRR
jgi:tRNA(adenine34) deaminase